jgi:hypothetical protein
VDWIKLFISKIKQVVWIVISEIFFTGNDKNVYQKSGFSVNQQKNNINTISNLYDREDVYETGYMLIDNLNQINEAMFIKIDPVLKLKSLTFIVETNLSNLENLWHKYSIWVIASISCILAFVVMFYVSIFLAAVIYKVNKWWSVSTTEDENNDSPDFRNDKENKNSLSRANKNRLKKYTQSESNAKK